VSFFKELSRRNVIKVAVAYVIVGWLILQAGEVLAPALHLPGWVNSALAFFLILGFPLAMIFAWAFEMTPDGIKREKDVDRSQSITNITGQKLNYTIIGLLLVTVIYFVYDKFLLQPQGTPEAQAVAVETSETPADEYQTIAVLPFINMSEDASNEYFSDGLTEELLNILAKIKELRVAGRTSSFIFKDKEEDLRTIGEKLNVNSILEGSVRKDDKRNRVRITAQLINVEDGYHLWSETYDRELDDIFAIQDEIAHEVAQALRITLLGEDETRLEQLASTEINAYELYLQGLQGINDGSFASLDRANKQFQQALALDPAYTPARIGLAVTLSAMANTGAITREAALDRGMPILDAVLAEQPDNSDALVQMAIFRKYEGNSEAADEAFVQALNIDPRNVYGLQSYGRFLFDHGSHEQGMELIEAALEIEPYSIQVLWDQCATNAFKQNMDVSLAACARIMEISPESPLGSYGVHIAHLMTGNIALAMKNFADAINLDPDDYEMVAGMSRYWLVIGDLERARQWLQRAEAIGAGQPIPTVARISFYLFQEQFDLARDLASRVVAQKIEDRYGSNSWFRFAIAIGSVKDGDYQAALAPYRTAFPWAFQSPLEFPANSTDYNADIMLLAMLLKLSDPGSEIMGQLLDLVEATADRFNPREGPWTPDLTHAAIAAIRGDHDTAIARLNSAWDQKWRMDWRETLLENPVFTQLDHEPGYQELVTRFKTEMESQREQAYELMGITQ